MYTMKTMSEIYDIDELPEVKFRLFLNLTNRGKTPSYWKSLNVQMCIFILEDHDTIELVTYKNRMVAIQKLQQYIVKWYHTDLFHPELDQTAAMILQNLCWPGLRKCIQIKVTIYDTCHRTKGS